MLNAEKPDTDQGLGVSTEFSRFLNGWGMLVAVVVLFGLLLDRGCQRPNAHHERQFARINLVPDVVPPPIPARPIQQPKPETTLLKQAERHAAVTKESRPNKSSHETHPAPILKMEGEAGKDGSSNIEAGSVAHDYIGQPLGANGGGRMQWDLYFGRLQRQLQQLLGQETDLQKSSYGCTIRVWLNADGSLNHLEPVPFDTEMKTKTLADPCISVMQVLRKLGQVVEAPPTGLPQPVVLRITNVKSST